MTPEEFYLSLIERLRALGHEIEEKTDYHFRVNGTLDVYPVNRRYHDIKKNERGGYRDVINFVQKYFKPD